MDVSEPPELSFRALRMLRAVAAGRAQLTCGSEPDLFIDGVPCCDQYAAHLLTHGGLVAPERSGRFGEFVPATLTENGRRAVAAVPFAA